MDIKYLKEFIMLAEKGNFLEAADCLYISQSSLSKHIKKLEEELGVEIFDRTTRKVILNEYGQHLLPYAKRIADTEFDYFASLQTKLEKQHGSITIGSIPSMAPYHITDKIAAFRKDNPNIAIEIIEGDSLFIRELLLQEKCDLAFLRDDNASFDRKDIIQFPYTIDSLVAVLPISHPFANADSLQLSKLSGETFLLFPEHSYMNELCIRECRHAGFEPTIAFTANRGTNIVSLVKKKMGISLMLKKPASFHPDPDVALIDIAPGIYSHLSLNYLKAHKLSEAADRFIHYVRNY
jgi:DNA-binding transcriptional LysR family regulator